MPALSVTIVMPVYKRTTYFREALDSALSQTIPVKIIVVDDASPPGSDFQNLIGADSDRVEYARCETNLGQAGHWTRCLSLVKTRWVIFLHDDDILLPNCVELLLQAAEHLPDRALYFGLYHIIDEKGAIADSRESWVDGQIFEVPPERYAYINDIGVAGMMIDASKARSLGGFKPGLKMTPDWDMWVRLGLHSGIVRINQITGLYREYFNLSRGTSVQELNGKRLVRIVVQQRRNQGYIREKESTFTLPSHAENYIIAGSMGMLSILGSKLTSMGKRIYIGYALRYRINTQGPMGRIDRALFIMSCWIRIAYSYVRPLRQFLRRSIGIKTYR